MRSLNYPVVTYVKQMLLLRTSTQRSASGAAEGGVPREYAQSNRGSIGK